MVVSPLVRMAALAGLWAAAAPALAQGACAQKAASVCGANVLEPTSAQVDALRGFAQRHGRYWKSKLKALWIDGKEERHPDAYLLRQVRNEFGPKWLTRLSLTRFSVKTGGPHV